MLRLIQFALLIVVWLVPPTMTHAQDASAVIGAATLPRDLTPWGMYLDADPVVKAVMIGLVLASMVTWTVWLTKTVEIWLDKREVEAGGQKLPSAQALAQAGERPAGTQGGGGEVVEGPAAEEKGSQSSLGGGTLKERTSWALHATVAG